MTTVDREPIDILESQTQNFRLLDRKPGALYLLEQTETHVKQVEDLLHHSLPGANREALARALAEAASLTGWQALDSGRIDKAWQYYETAKAGSAREPRPRGPGACHRRAELRAS